MCGYQLRLSGLSGQAPLVATTTGLPRMMKSEITLDAKQSPMPWVTLATRLTVRVGMIRMSWPTTKELLTGVMPIAAMRC